MRSRTCWRTASCGNSLPSPAGHECCKPTTLSEWCLNCPRPCRRQLRNSMKVSVIIPCRNEKRHICEFLDSLLAQEMQPGWEMEVLVADGRSDDGTRDVLQQYGRKAPNVRVIDNPGQIVSSGLNAAIAEATGEIVIRMDAHTTYARDYVLECVKTLQESGADNVGGPWVAEGEGWMGRAIAAAFHSRLCTGGGKAHDPGYEGEVDTVYL